MKSKNNYLYMLALSQTVEECCVLMLDSVQKLFNKDVLMNKVTFVVFECGW